MNAALTWTTEGERIALAGRIDENANLEALAADVPPAGATIDLAGLTRINSIGVREWMDFLSAMAERRMRLVRCAPVFVEQMNAIANFSGAAEVTSVLALFECEVDGEAVHVEVTTADARAQRFPDAPACPVCGAQTIPAQENDLYYRFLRYAR